MTYPVRRLVSCALSVAAIGLYGTAWSVENEACFTCHADKDLSKTSPNGATVSLHVDNDAYLASAHAALECVTCHADITDVPHPEGLKKVDCAPCHEDQAKIYAQSLHGQALTKGDPLAPACADCHGKHDILARGNAKSRTNPINIPANCGGCHAENAPVARSRNIKEHDILQRYDESIHGVGLNKKGLTVTAVCTSCHTAHAVLPHTDPKSSISREKIVGTCTQCHALIETVHRKVIEGELWEKDPSRIPVCIECHQPHEARKVYYEEGASDKDCMICHAKAVQGAKREIPAVDTQQIAGSMHKKQRCAQCHTGINVSLKRACETVAPKVDCSICHPNQVQQHQRSIHGQLMEKGDPEAPVCLDCHSGHGTQSKADAASPTFPNNVPNLCGRCHREGEKAAKRLHSTQQEIIRNYTSSIHGKGLLEAGLVVTATCTSCHTAHQPLPVSDTDSSVNPKHIADTCGKCHEGIENTFLSSIHSPQVSKSDKELPVCSSCHSSHTITRKDEADFKLRLVDTCGRCHQDVADTYVDTYHGKVSKLGSTGAAKCNDCHGAHDILPVTDPKSRLSRDNIVETCAKCHPGSHRRFAGYLTHATHHDPKKYPALFYAFWGMTGLLLGTFGFFGLHTLAWLPLSFKEMRRHKETRSASPQRMFRRFDPIVRQMHFVLILSFFGLALTGMALKFSYTAWAVWLSNALGGFHSTGTIHRFCAVVMVVVFLIHLAVVAQRKRSTGKSWKNILLGSGSLVPNLNDAREFLQTVRWFAGRGPRPNYGEWTYWEKFDYFAVFWGVAIIGSTGFILWFPELCTYVLPGWFINVATIIHSDEALLAVGFIFTIHFFNTHFRPEKFPMDMVMFTGRVALDELERERPRYYEELKSSGELEKRTVAEAPKELRFWTAIFGTVALIVGFSLVLFIIWSMVFGYQ
ncbi:MAG: cytochrome c3 family protein [Candidatus Hydrogenedentes bacterium]|nr:cytochrome c3 family protein [Candidatus Hydrogenedentota bacterium]